MICAQPVPWRSLMLICLLQMQASCCSTLQYVKQFDGTIINVPSDHRIVEMPPSTKGVASTRLGMYGIPDVLEEVMVERDILLAEYAASGFILPVFLQPGH